MTPIERRGASAFAKAARRRKELGGVPSGVAKPFYLLADYIAWLETPFYIRWWKMLCNFFDR